MNAGSEVPRCLIVVGHDLLANFIDVLLNHGEYDRKRTRTVDEAVEQMRRWQPHLAIVQLDIEGGRGGELIGQPGADGPVPVIILTPTGEMRAKLQVFQRGADDVLGIPFAPEELVARALSLVKRRHGIEVTFRPAIQLGHLELDILAQKVRVDRREVDLTGREASILYVLAAAAGRPVEREQLLTYMYGNDSVVIASNVIDRYIAELRRKLGGEDTSKQFIETAPGGYLLRTEQPRSSMGAR